MSAKRLGGFAAVLVAVAGSVSLLAQSVAGTGGYFTDSVSGSISGTVGAPTLTITAWSGPMVYGDTAPTITPIYDGFVHGDTEASLDPKPTCSTTATNLSLVGSTNTSSCSGAGDPNYTIVYVTGTVTVAARPLTITATARSKTVGTTLDLGTTAFTTSGPVNGDTVSGVTLTSGGAAAGSAVGPYDIVPSDAVGTGLSNYSITYAKGTLTVQPVGESAPPSASASATPKPTLIVAGATGTPAPSSTPPATSGTGSSRGPDSAPLFALLICLGFGGIGLLAAQAQRRGIRR